MNNFEDDMLNSYKATKDTAPDGIMDATPFIETLKQLVDAFDYNTEDNEMSRLMLRCISLSVDSNSSVDDMEINPENMMQVMTSLCLMISVMSKLASAMDDDFVENYKIFMSNVLIPNICESGSYVPYWND